VSLSYAIKAVPGKRPDTKTLVDRVLEGCFQLISLFFMTIGKNNEAPAAYALTSTIRRLLDHLTEVQLYSAKDLAHVAHTIENLSEIVSNSHGKYSPKLVTLLANRLDVCRELCSNLQQKLERLDPGLTEIHEKIISILRSISAANTKAKVQRYCRFIYLRSIT
jgi:chemotaxis protein histidine kinase CheA